MLVNGSGGKATATGQVCLAATEAAQHRTHEVIAGTQLLHQYRVRLFVLNIGAVNGDNAVILFFNMCTHARQNVKQNTDIGNIRNIFNAATTGNQQGCRKNGNGCIFCAADGDRPM